MILLVLDSVGIGALPDADAYGDVGSNTVGHIAAHVGLDVPALRRLGLGALVDLGGPPLAPYDGVVCRMAERSPGKDSVTGHWELMGLVLEEPFPVFPAGFPAPVVDAFERRIGRQVLGNCVASGTEIIERLGEEHVRTGRPILYTSADSVFQLAAHEAVIPVDELYRMCEAAYTIVVEGLGVGRVIARPFTGSPGRFTRTARRHDFARPPSGETLLDRLTAHGIPVVAIGKINDLFAGRGVTRAIKTASDAEGLARVADEMAADGTGLVFANLVDFDTLYGHRNDAAGYARNLEQFDRWLAGALSGLRPDDLLIVTADHGNDPTTPSTDHSREYVPLLVTGAAARSGDRLADCETFADLAQTLADLFDVPPLAHGTSLLEVLLRHNREEDLPRHAFDS